MPRSLHRNRSYCLIDQMIKNVADALELSEDQINIKATTEEGLGFTGTLQVFHPRRSAAYKRHRIDKKGNRIK